MSDIGKQLKEINRHLARIADRLISQESGDGDTSNLRSADAFVWMPQKRALMPVATVNRIPLDLLQGIDRNRDTLVENTQRFARRLPANNALLWGARGTGKSSLVKAVHAFINDEAAGELKLIEIHREDIPSLPELMNRLRGEPFQCVLFCDDLSFGYEDSSYKSLKAVLEGGIEGRPANVVFYATSNRRHLMPRDMSENEQATALHPGEAVEENVSLSDRFGLWLGFHKCSQEDYLLMIERYMAYYGLNENWETVRTQALAWATQRGARSGRVAWQFIQDLAGRLGRTL